jgi:membrane protein implicated in regulation of membrane protease activity
VFGHAPVILPGVLRVPLPYHPAFYLHLALLHAGLLVRIVGGNLLEIPGAWQLGGTLNVLAILLFLAVSVAAAVLGTLRQRRAPGARRRQGNPST